MNVGRILGIVAIIGLGAIIYDQYRKAKKNTNVKVNK